VGKVLAIARAVKTDPNPQVNTDHDGFRWARNELYFTMGQNFWIKPTYSLAKTNHLIAKIMIN